MIKGFMIDPVAYCDMYGLDSPININFIRGLPEDWQSLEPYEIMIVQRDYDTLALKDYGIYVAYAYYDFEDDKRILSNHEIDQYKSFLNDPLPDDIEMKPYYIESESGIFLDYYDCERTFIL